MRHNMRLTPSDGTRFSLCKETVAYDTESPDAEPFSDSPLPVSHEMLGSILSPMGMKVKPFDSLLSQIKDYVRYQEVVSLAIQYSAIAIYHDWNLSRRGSIRSPQLADVPGDLLFQDGSNLPLVLNDLEHRSGVLWNLLQEKMRTFHEAFSRVSTRTLGGTIQVFLHEEGLKEPIPATRLSDGTLRYLCLLAILCHPTTPPLICIEEPEIGLHPDILPTIADLLVEASQRTQLIVTTHSDILIDALTDTPESVVVCEKEEGSTVLKRLNRKKLAVWLKDYSLGKLWLDGEIGGNRW
jgi:predicted ATPase